MRHLNLLAPTLAQYTSQTAMRILLPLVFLLILSAVLVGALAVVRRKVHGSSHTSTARDFSLGDLRALHREGKLTDPEFERAKAKLVSTARSTLLKETKPTMAEEPMGEELKDA